MCISIVTVALFHVNGFSSHDLAFLCGTGCDGQQWLWRGTGMQVLIADKRQC